MDIEPQEYIPTEEEQEISDFIDGYDKGEAKIEDTPIKLYFEDHSELYLDPCALDYIINDIKIKTIGEFVDKYSDILKAVLEKYPYLNQEDILDHMAETYSKIVDDTGKTLTLRTGSGRLL